MTVPIVCPKCGVVLVIARVGSEAWCPRCKSWAGPAPTAKPGVLG